MASKHDTEITSSPPKKKARPNLAGMVPVASSPRKENAPPKQSGMASIASSPLTKKATPKRSGNAPSTSSPPLEKPQPTQPGARAQFPARAKHFVFFYSALYTAFNGENGYLSQTLRSPVTIPNEGKDGGDLKFASLEHYYRKRKAVIHHAFNSKKVTLGGDFDEVPLDKLVETMMAQKTVANLRDLDRTFEMTPAGINAWQNDILPTLLKGNFYKFATNTKLREKLLATGTKYLVEACHGKKKSKYTERCGCNCGIGYDWLDAFGQEAKWERNLLGKTLMKVRQLFTQNPDMQQILAEQLAEAYKIEHDFQDGRENCCSCC